MAGSSTTWERVRLGDIVKITHGWPFKSEFFTEERQGRPIIVSIGNFQYTGGFRFDSTAIKEYAADYPKEYELSPRDILLVMTCQTSGGEILGIPGRIPDDGKIYLHNQRLGKVVVKERKRIDPDFVYYLAFWSDFNRELCVSASGTKILHTAPVRIEAFEFNLPPLPEQKAIAQILGSLDDKIELNRRANQTLEALTRALFKSWFIDFDPVRAKAARQKSKSLDSATAALFPSAFETSPMGEIPKGWKVGMIGDVAENPRRGVQPSDIENATPYIGLEHMPRRRIALSDWGYSDDLGSNKYAFRRGEILFGKLRPYFHKVGVAPLDGVCSTDILVVVPKTPEWFGFLLAHISSDEFVQHTDAASTGTKMPRTNWPDMARYSIVLPTDKVATAFTDIVRPLVSRIEANIHECQSLATARDALLPKLLSGEVTCSQQITEERP